MLSVLDDNDKCDVRPTVKEELLDKVVTMLSGSLQMSLYGVDVVVEKGTGLYAIIDINAFPGKDIASVYKVFKSILAILHTYLVFNYLKFRI